MSDVTVLLTATIDPGETVFVTRADPIERLKDYEIALSRWISADLGVDFVFFENSGYDLTSLKRISDTLHCTGIEFLSVRENGSGKVRGKGYSELLGIERAFALSKRLSKSKVVVKCTGRLFVDNATSVMDAISADSFDVMCTLRRNLSFADSFFFAAKPHFFCNELVSRAEIVDDTVGVYFEHALACAVGGVVARRGVWRPFPVLPRIVGISGTDGATMTRGKIAAYGREVYNRFRNVVYRR